MYTFVCILVYVLCGYSCMYMFGSWMYLDTARVLQYAFSFEKQSRCEDNIETSYPNGFEKIEPKTRFLHNFLKKIRQSSSSYTCVCVYVYVHVYV